MSPARDGLTLLEDRAWEWKSASARRGRFGIDGGATPQQRMRWGLALIPAMLCLALPATQVQAAETHQAAFAAIDHPREQANRERPGNVPQGNNNRAIVGYYVDGGGRVFGWRYDEGRFTDINDPSADNAAPGHGTTPITLSDNGREVVGYYADATGLFHGFTLRRGQYTTLDVPFSGATGTFAQGVDDAGLISGGYLDSSETSTGSSCGTVTTRPSTTRAQQGDRDCAGQHEQPWHRGGGVG